MKIAVGTMNKAKMGAVLEVVPTVWKNAEFVQVEVQSGVRVQPMTDEEGITGATNRAKAALKAVKGAEYGIGMEGTVDQNEYGMFLGGWVVIIGKDGTTGVGGSGRVMLPGYLKERLNAGEELGPVLKEALNDTKGEIRHGLGAFGILTSGMRTRVDQFKEATIMALAVFVSPEAYKSEKALTIKRKK